MDTTGHSHRINLLLSLQAELSKKRASLGELWLTAPTGQASSSPAKRSFGSDSSNNKTRTLIPFNCVIPLGICTASKAVSAVVLSHLIHTVFLSVFTALALAKSTLCRSTSSFQRSAEHCLASQPAWGYPRVSWDLRDLPSIPHLPGEVANYQTLIICYNNPDIKKKKN